DTVLGPEMRSTGEVMGLAESFGVAYVKSQLAAGSKLPREGRVFISVCRRDKQSIIFIARELSALGYDLVSTTGTAEVLRRSGIAVEEVAKAHEGRPNIVDRIINKEIVLVINTPWGRGTRSDGYQIRTVTAAHGVAYVTTIAAAAAVVQGLKALRQGELEVKALQDYHRPPTGSPTGGAQMNF
ncbi:MAG: carbamoyl phosphate synthase large subunit, partial [Actinomycetota bacterium]|nr:carbamoyl phosphate synthase large subunit [Actinomycetota bacterium]